MGHSARRALTVEFPPQARTLTEDQADRVLKTFKTQSEAISWAKRKGHEPLVARVHYLDDKKIADHWRSA